MSFSNVMAKKYTSSVDRFIGPRQAKTPSNMRIQIILRMRRVSSEPLLSIHTINSSRGLTLADNEGPGHSLSPYAPRHVFARRGTYNDRGPDQNV